MINPFFIFENVSHETRLKWKKYTNIIYFFPRISFYILLFGISYVLLIDKTPETVSILYKKDNVFTSVNRICFYENDTLFKECLEFGNSKRNIKISSQKIELLDNVNILNIEIH